MVSETKIDKSFPESQFIIEGYTQNLSEEIHIRDDTPCKEIKTQKLTYTSGLFGGGGGGTTLKKKVSVIF